MGMEVENVEVRKK